MQTDNSFNSQKGFVQILVLLLLLTGVGVGTYLVSQRTNLAPKAQKATVSLIKGAQIPSDQTVSRLKQSPYKDVGWVKFQYQWANPDAPVETWVDQARASGYKVLLSVAKKPLPPKMPDDEGYEDFGAFMENLSRKMGSRVDAYEIWNEPNLRGEWAGFGQPNPKSYVRLLKEGYNGVKRGNPSAKVISAALAPLSGEYNDDQFFQEFVAAGGLEYADAVGWHSNVVKNIPPKDPHPEGFQRVKIALTSGKPVWITEFGWDRNQAGIDRATHDRYIKEAFDIAPSLGNIEAMFIWNFGFSKESSDKSFVGWDIEGNPGVSLANNPCRDNPVAPPQTSTSDNFSYIWKADCASETSKKCVTNNNCPQNTSDSVVNPQTSNWCFEFSEGNRCMQLQRDGKTSSNNTGEPISESEGIQLPFAFIKLGTQENIDDIKRQSSIAFNNYKTFSKILDQINSISNNSQAKRAAEIAKQKINSGEAQMNACISTN